MCGIVGYVGGREACPVLLKGLHRLEYRGYDSAGVAMVGKDGALNVYKCKGKVSDLEHFLEGKELGGSIGIAHTRWATHGVPNDVNAHPHYSESENIALIHNGIIENYRVLKDALEENGYTFRSSTDSEVLVNLIEYIRTTGGCTLLEAVQQALRQVVGAYAIAVIEKGNRDEIIAARQSSPMAIGIGEGEFFLSSDAASVIEYTQDFVYVNDGEIAVINRHKPLKIVTLDNHEGRVDIKKLQMSISQLEKGGYPHFMLKEIYEQPKTIVDCIRGRISPDTYEVKLSGVIDNRGKFLAARRIVFVACGTSWHAALIGEHLIENICRIPVEVEYASEFRYRNPIINADDIVIAVSQSGETADTLAAVELARKAGAFVFGICNVVGSSIARATDSGAYIHVGPEIGVASTKAFTGQVTVMAMLALAVGREKGTVTEEYYREVAKGLLELPAVLEDVLGLGTVLLRQPGEQGVEGRVCQEIVDHDQRSAMSRSGDPPGQHGLADNDVGIGGNAVRGTVADHHADARIGEPFSKPRGTQRTRPHARIAGENHLADMCREVLRGLYGGRPALRGGDCACRHILRGGGTPDEGRRHEQRHRRGDQHSGQHDEGLAFGSHGQHRNDAAGRSRRHQSGPGKRKEQQPGGTARNRGEDQRRARQDIGKIDFVDTAAELDDYGAGRRLAHIAAAEKPAGQQYAQPGAWIRFQQEHDRLPGFAGLLDADRREDAVVQGIIEEQHLGRLDQKRHERQQSVADHDLHAVADQQRQPRHRTADDPIAQYGQQHTEDAYREIAHEHLEARLYASLRKFVEPPDRIPAQRAHDHGSDEHRDIAADDDAHGGNGPDYPAAFAGDVAPGRIGDQQRQQVGQHRVDQACHLGVGPPSRGDEERRDESPRDERADIGHDHAAQGPAEFLYLLSHSFLSCI